VNTEQLGLENTLQLEKPEMINCFCSRR